MINQAYNKEKKVELEDLLEYELRASHRYCRFVSLLLVKCEENQSVKNILGDYIRETDMLFDFKDASAILMGETDKKGTLNAVERYKNECDSKFNMRFAVVSYPNDGRSTKDLLDALIRRYEQAKHGKSGVVVAKG
jgi:ribosome biogenesis GTPase A